MKIREAQQRAIDQVTYWKLVPHEH
jgi:hypothetical protein